MAYMPIERVNGYEAVRLLDLLGYTPKEISLLYKAVDILQVHPIVGDKLFGDLQKAFAKIASLEKKYSYPSEAFFNEASAEYARVETSLNQLTKLLNLDELKDPYEFVETLKHWLNSQLPHGLPAYMEAS